MKRNRNKKTGKDQQAPDKDTKPNSKPVAKTKSTGTHKLLVSGGRVAVDPECKQKVGVSHVYEEENDIYDCMLNQTNVANNNNKYYVIQLLVDDKGKGSSYSVWTRWGRVGFTGQSSLQACGSDLEAAKKVFCKKFYDKTRNDWVERKQFKKVAGKYDLIAVDYSTSEEPKAKKRKKTKAEKIPECTLGSDVQQLITLITDMQMMEQSVVEMKYDTSKAPLGRLTPEQIKAGFVALNKIDVLLKRKAKSGKALQDACSEFYTRVPHDFGMRKPPLITDLREVKEKTDLLQSLSNIEIAVNIIKESPTKENPLDRRYKSLNCTMASVQLASEEFKLIDRYLQNTHASTHAGYSMQLLHLFRCSKDEQIAGCGNRMLLWHGSRLLNWAGILSQGLRIAPPEAPVTGYMFGRGVYFADMSSKSANYCWTNKSNNVGLMALCEVALGKTNDLLEACYEADQLPPGKHSVRGLGKVGPDPKKAATLDDGTVVPMGPSVETGVVNPRGYTLNYNEYIVYDVNQIRLRFLCQIKFNYKY